MQTQVYARCTTDELQAAVEDGEAMLLRERLGLPEVEKPYRFRLLTEEESMVFKVLFPASTNIENYKEYIPSDVLEALIEAKGSCPWRMVESPVVWHAKAYDPDPVLLLPIRQANDAYNWPTAYVLVARWGDALEDFAVLAAKAFVKWKENRRNEVLGALHKAESELKKLEAANAIYTTSSF